MRRVGHHLIRDHGFSLPELMVVIGMIGVLAVAAFPVFVNFLQTQRTRGAAQELANLLNQARQLAISTNSRYRVTIDTNNNRLLFEQSVDGGANYTAQIGPGTDANGFRKLENQATLSATNVTPVFNHLGTLSSNAGTITVQDSSGSSSLGVVVSSGGRIRICPPNCP